MVKVYLAVKRRIQPGDKMAGRHGNKGVISVIMPVEDMPYTSRRRAGGYRAQPARRAVAHERGAGAGDAPGHGGARGSACKIDAMLRRAAQGGGAAQVPREVYNTSGKPEHLDELSVTTRSWTGAQPDAAVCRWQRRFRWRRRGEIKQLLELAGMDESGQVTLYDGRTGDPSTDRSPWATCTCSSSTTWWTTRCMRAPPAPTAWSRSSRLGGKAQFGGQRFGEMEVWALEAYGAAYTLQEMLTVKSDDVAGRTKMYKNIVDGDHRMEPGMPESFNVLVKEIRSLGIDIELESE
jgi:DNA-directed RNA polymerase subunit beta